MYRDLEFYRTGDGRRRARLNHLRGQGELIKAAATHRPFSGG
jgi:hypothetical protein